MSSAHFPGKRPRNIALCAPAVRLVAVTAMAYFGEDPEASEGVEVSRYPVIAIRSTWSADGEGIEDDLMVLAPDEYDCFDLIPVRYLSPFNSMSYGRGSADFIGEVVPCPWPAREDPEHLGPIVEQIKQRALEGLRGLASKKKA